MTTYVSDLHKAANTVQDAAEKATRRAFQNLAIYFELMEDKGIARLFKTLSVKQRWSLRDVAKIVGWAEKKAAVLATVSPEERARLASKETPKSDPKRMRMSRASRAEDILNKTADTLLRAIIVSTPGLYRLSEMDMYGVFLLASEVAEYTMLTQLGGGTCRCGCSFLGSKSDFSRIEKQFTEVGQAERRWQEQDIQRSIDRLGKDHTLPHVPEELRRIYARLDDTRRETEGNTQTSMDGLLGMLRRVTTPTREN